MVRIHNAIRDDALVNNAFQGVPFRIGDDLCIQAPPALEQSKYRDFPRSSLSTFALTDPTKITFIHFDLTGEVKWFSKKGQKEKRVNNFSVSEFSPAPSEYRPP